MLDRLVDFFLQFLQFFQFVHRVNAYQRGVVLNRGRFSRMAEPGLVWVCPFYVEEVYLTTVVDEPMEVGPLSLTTKDGKSVVVSAIFLIPIKDPKKFLLELEGANAAVLLIARGALAELVQTHTLEELGKFDDDDEDDESDEEPRKKPVTISKKLAAVLRKRVRKYGVGVRRAQIVELTTARSIRLWGHQ